jgi:hypothetical protein
MPIRQELAYDSHHLFLWDGSTDLTPATVRVMEPKRPGQEDYVFVKFGLEGLSTAGK